LQNQPVKIVNDAVGQTISKLRQNRGLSQEELADRAGIHRTYVSQLERGIKSPTLAVLIKIARALDTKPSELLRAVEDELD
jgi:transcriptional regulator with XRE-family HTH domain